MINIKRMTNQKPCSMVNPGISVKFIPYKPAIKVIGIKIVVIIVRVIIVSFILFELTAI